jgi:TATA-binding protein-associated factor Taf7
MGAEEVARELDQHIQAIREAAFRLKRSAGGVQAIERNVDRLLASAKMLEINVSDIVGRPRGMACWTEDDAAL